MSCKNCGHPSHCGGPLHRDETDYDGRLYTIKVCYNCNCKNCSKEK